MAKRECGDCSLCCKVLEVPALYKPQGQWCKHCKPGSGCATYRLRPKACRDFNCLWLTEDWLNDDWKPKTAKFVLMWEYDFKSLTVVTDPNLPNAWKAEPYYSTLKALATKHLSEHRLVMVISGDKRSVILPDQEVLIGHQKEKIAWEVMNTGSAETPSFHVEFQYLNLQAADPIAV